MSPSIRRNRCLKIAAALLIGAGATVLAPGCDSAPGQGSVEMGGKDARDKINPGAPPAAPEGAAAKPGAKSNAIPGRSIKERPTG